MKFVALQKNTRQTPRKVRLVVNQVKDLSLEQALRQLAVMDRRSTLVIMKTLKQAIANAQNNHGVAASQLEIESIIVNEGPRFRRFQAVSRGRAHGIIKRTSHVQVTLRQKAAPVAAKAEVTATEKVEKKTESTVKEAKTPKTVATEKKTTKKVATKQTSSKKSK